MSDSTPDLKDKVSRLCKAAFGSTPCTPKRLSTLVDSLYDLCLDHAEAERTRAWDEGFDAGVEETESDLSGDYDRGFDDGYAEGYQEGLDEGEANSDFCL